MKITQEAEYAIQIVDYLARSGKRARAPEISEGTDAPLRFTKNILQKLARTEMINSYMGHRGGYELGRLPEEISLFEVMEATEGPIQLHRCLAGEHECGYIPDKLKCPYRALFRELSSDMERKMRKFRFSSSAHDLRLGDFLGWTDKREMNHFVHFSTREQGYDRNEVDAYIARIQQEWEALDANYKAL